MSQIGPLSIGITFVTTWGVMLMYLLPCSLPIHPSDINWLNSTHAAGQIFILNHDNSPKKNIPAYKQFMALAG
jgi:hypothetical protein